MPLAHPFFSNLSILEKYGISRNFTGVISQVETTKTIQYWVRCGKCQKKIAGQIHWGSDAEGIAFMAILDRHHDGCSRLPVMFRRREV